MKAHTNFSLLFSSIVALVLVAPGCAGVDDPNGAADAEDDLTADGVSVAARKACSKLVAPSFGASARAFMASNGLVRLGEEGDAEGGISTSWSLVKVVPIPKAFAEKSTCAVAMNLKTRLRAGSTDTTENGQSWEVVAYKPATKTFHRFESQVRLPKRLYVGISDPFDTKVPGQPLLRGNLTHFYAELQGANLVEAYKVILSDIRVAVLSAQLSTSRVRELPDGIVEADPDGKLAFDPTPGRTWKLKDVTIDLRRGYTAETFDINPALIDADFRGSYAGGHGGVMPWNSCFILRWRTPEVPTWKSFPQTIIES